MSELPITQIQTQSRCLHLQLDNDINLFEFQNASKRGVDEFIDGLQILYQDRSPNDQLLILIDLRPDGWPPMNYLFKELRTLHSHNPLAPHQKFAFLYSESFLMTVAQSFFDVIHRDSKAEFFSKGCEHEAMDWLISDF